MRKWTREEAERFIHNRIAANRIILVDGTMGLTECSAMDYLEKNHGYIRRTVEPKEDGK